MKTITDIKKVYPKFFNKSLMSQFSGKVYKNTVPSKTVLKLYEQFRKIYLNSQSKTLEFYLKEYKSL